MSAMRRGDFEAAWKVCDAVLAERGHERTRHAPRHEQIVWDGRPIDGKRVLVRCHHGLGDTLQFVRLLPLLRERVREIVLWAQPELLGLLRAARGFDRLLPLHEGEPDVDRDADVELMELPYVLRLDAARIPARVPYLHVAPRTRHGAAPRVGLAWRAGDWNPARSIPAALLAPLARARGVRYASVQYGADEPLPFPAVDLACRDLVEQARRLAALDLVVSVDTMSAHLAGALGLPTWTLLPTPCDWRWMDARSDTPWYPTMRLFRQPREGDWAAVFERVADALEERGVRSPRERAGALVARLSPGEP